MSRVTRLGRRRLVGLGLVGGLWVVLLPRIARQHRSLLRLGVAKRYNELTRKISGTERSAWGLLTHVGRRSGRTYQTSLGTCPFHDGFLLPLGYGTQTDWYRNVMAARTCQLAWKGQTYDLERPELISGAEVMKAWPTRDRILLQLAGIHDFVWLQRAPVPSQARPPVQHAAAP